MGTLRVPELLARDSHAGETVRSGQLLKARSKTARSYSVDAYEDLTLA